jgi:hypothetical protein
MNQAFYNQVAGSTTHRPIRDALSGQVLNDKSLLPDLLEIAFDTTDKNHHKSCWIMELVFEAKTEWLAGYLDAFCTTLASFTNESAIRPVAKTCLFALQYSQGHLGFLNAAQLDKITEACFDWLINPETKVATKAYAMRALYLIGKKEHWIYPELSRILSEDTVKHTAAYGGAARDILKKINNGA